jgi:hypothetical protein
MLRPLKFQKSLVCSLLLALPAAISLAQSAQAFSLFTGYDENPADKTVLPLASRVNSMAAFNDYRNNLGGVGVTTESFETTAVKTPINNLAPTLSGVTSDFIYTTDAAGTITAGTSDTVSVQQANAGMTNAGTFPTDGVRGISINSNNFFKIKFASPLAAFSFWGTDLGDINNTLTVILRNAGMQVGSQQIDYLGANAGASSVFFFGAIATDSGELFDEVQLLSSSTSTTGDAIGIDQLTVGTAAQVTPSSTPVPTPALLPGLVAMLAGVRRRSKAAQ